MSPPLGVDRQSPTSLSGQMPYHQTQMDEETCRREEMRRWCEEGRESEGENGRKLELYMIYIGIPNSSLNMHE